MSYGISEIELSRHVAFRVDASEVIGAGHLMRCLTLANQFRAIGISCFFLGRADKVFRNYITDAGYDFVRVDIKKRLPMDAKNHLTWLGHSVAEDVEFCISNIILRDADLCIVDHYGVPSEWENLVRESACPVIAIDDLASRRHSANIIIDHNVGREQQHYLNLLDREATLLLGGRFCLIRNEFLIARREYFVREKMAHILVTLGGSDNTNITMKVLGWLSNSKFGSSCHVKVILGGGYRHSRDLYEFLEVSNLKVDVHHNVGNMGDVLLWADLVIGSGGVSAWERCCVGVPAITFLLAENQVFICRSLAESGASIICAPEIHQSEFLGTLEQCSSFDQRYSMSTEARSLVDGEGPARLVESIQKEMGWI